MISNKFSPNLLLHLGRVHLHKLARLERLVLPAYFDVSLQQTRESES